MAAEELALEVAVEGFKEFQRTMGDMDGSIDDTGKKWGGLGDVLSGVAKVGLAAVATGAVAAVGAVAGLTAGIVKLTMEAMPVEGLAAAFEGLTADMVGGSQAMLAALQESSAGMIANRDLMESFNKAAGLVSIDFAQKLPEAMQYLGKVSAATGTDLDFLLSSLVTGVGRLSPMILDNLQITVNAVEANELYAASHGLVASELDKGQQQMAMYELTLAKLEEKTAAMPEVTDTAAASMAQWQTGIQNLKDDIGVAFLPALHEMLSVLSELAQEYGPQVVEWAQIAGEWLGENLPIAIKNTKAFLVDVLIPALQEAWAFIQENVIPILAEVWAWFMEHLPAAIEFEIGWIGLQISWLKILWAYFKENILPVLIEVARVLIDVVGEAVRILTDLWQDYLYPALVLVWEFIQEYVIPLLTALADLIGTVLAKAVEILAALWQNVLLPALEDVWDFLDKYVMPILSELADVILPALALGFEIITGWIRDLIDFFKRLGDVIDSIEIPNWMKGESPPPMAVWLGEIATAMQRLTDIEIPRLATEFTVLHQVAQPALGAASGGSYSPTYAPQYNLTTQSMTQPGALRLEFQAMEAMATR